MSTQDQVQNQTSITITDMSLHHGCNHREDNLFLLSYHVQFLVVDPLRKEDPHIVQELGQSGHSGFFRFAEVGDVALSPTLGSTAPPSAEKKNKCTIIKHNSNVKLKFFINCRLNTGCKNV